jgi:CrcB protein
MKLTLIIGLGGFLGSISRYMLHVFILRLFPVVFPVGTFSINLIGSFFLGVILALAEHHKVLNQEWRMFLAVGFCGSFTTFSTFALEGMHLLQQKSWIIFGSYTIGSIISGVLCAAAGYYIFAKF